MTFRESILLESKIWTLEKQSLDPDYFKHLSRRTRSSTLWIDSSDNLVPVRELTNTDPGQIIVHRNLACQIRPDDISLMATVEHALEAVAVDLIIVCGYSHCSGIRDVITDSISTPHLDHWLDELKDIYRRYIKEMDKLTLHQKEKYLCELNIRQQVLNLSKLEVVQQYWNNGRKLILLGWYFDLGKGVIQEIFSMQERDLLTHVSTVS